MLPVSKNVQKLDVHDPGEAQPENLKIEDVSQVETSLQFKWGRIKLSFQRKKFRPKLDR